MEEQIIKPRNIYSQRIPVTLDCEGVGLTKQEFKESTDVNNIMKRYVKTGILPVCQQAAIYGDYTDVPSYQDAMQTVILAQEQFERLPSDLRKKLDHDPEKFLAWVEKAEDKELVKYGLMDKKDLTDDTMPDKQGVDSPQPEGEPSE